MVREREERREGGTARGNWKWKEGLVRDWGMGDGERGAGGSKRMEGKAGILGSKERNDIQGVKERKKERRGKKKKGLNDGRRIKRR